MHMMAVLDAIKKRGYFKGYDKAQKAHNEAKKAIELAEAGLALLEGTSAGTKKNFKKKALDLQRPRKPQRKPWQRSQIPSQKSQGS